VVDDDSELLAQLFSVSNFLVLPLLFAAPVVVTSATHTAPGGYPVTQLPPPGYPAGNAYVAPVGYPAQTTG